MSNYTLRQHTAQPETEPYGTPATIQGKEGAAVDEAMRAQPVVQATLDLFQAIDDASKPNLSRPERYAAIRAAVDAVYRGAELTGQITPEWRIVRNGKTPMDVAAQQADEAIWAFLLEQSYAYALDIAPMEAFLKRSQYRPATAREQKQQEEREAASKELFNAIEASRVEGADMDACIKNMKHALRNGADINASVGRFGDASRYGSPLLVHAAEVAPPAIVDFMLKQRRIDVHKQMISYTKDESEDFQRTNKEVDKKSRAHPWMELEPERDHYNSVSALMVASGGEKTRMILEHGGDRYQRDGFIGSCALHYAASLGRGDLDKVDVLMEGQPLEYIDIPNFRKETPIFRATTPAMVVKMHSYGANLNKRRDDRYTILAAHIENAFNYGDKDQVECIRTLMELGADPYAKVPVHVVGHANEPVMMDAFELVEHLSTQSYMGMNKDLLKALQSVMAEARQHPQTPQFATDRKIQEIVLDSPGTKGEKNKAVNGLYQMDMYYNAAQQVAAIPELATKDGVVLNEEARNMAVAVALAQYNTGQLTNADRTKTRAAFQVPSPEKIDEIVTSMVNGKLKGVFADGIVTQREQAEVVEAALSSAPSVTSTAEPHRKGGRRV